MNEAATNVLLGASHCSQISSKALMKATTTPNMRLTSTLDMPTTASATQDALAVPEILANILSNLSVHHLTRAKRVSLTWNFVCSDSPSVRKAYFTYPDLTADTRMLHIFRYVGAFFQIASFTRPPFPGIDMASYAMVHVVNVHPLLTPRSIASHIRVSQMELDFPNLHELLALPAGGSWKQALLTQPPVCCIMIEVHGKLLGPGFGLSLEIEGGVRLGRVVQALRAHMPEIPSAPTWSEHQLDLRKQFHVIGLVPNAVSATSSLVSQAKMFQTADSKAAEKAAKKPKRTKKRGRRKRR